MLENLNATFIAEAHELLNDLEKALLQLEHDSQNKEGISEVFRTMHSLKGSASMFGFEAISELTHDLETIYESIRSGTAQLTLNILSATLKSLDHLKKLLEDSGLKNKDLKKAHEELLKEIEVLNQEVKDAPEKAAASKTEADTLGSFYVLFNPVPEILRHGTNTLYLVEDLLALGEGVCLPFFNALPTLTEIDPENSYTGFEVVLTTTRTEQEIREVFMFVETECELVVQKLSDQKLPLEEVKGRLLAHGKIILHWA